MNIIRKIIEPSRLILAWQPPREIDATRTRRAVGELSRLERNLFSFRYLVGTEDYNKARSYSLEQYLPFIDEKEYVGEFVADSFIQRLPPRSRRDFGKFLSSLCLDPDARISNFALLGYSGCYLPSDNFSIVNTFDGISCDCQFLLEIAGFSYYSKMFEKVELGMNIDVRLEPDNKWDKDAVMFAINGEKIGNVNRLMLPSFHRWLKNGRVEAIIERIEGSIDKPRVFVFISVHCHG